MNREKSERKEKLDINIPDGKSAHYIT